MNAEAREHISRLVDAAPPLNPAQQLRLAVLLRPDLPVGLRLDPADAPVTHQRKAA